MGRPRIRTPEYWRAYRRRRYREKKRQVVLQCRRDRGCDDCKHFFGNHMESIRELEEQLGRPVDLDFAECETRYREMIGQN